MTGPHYIPVVREAQRQSGPELPPQHRIAWLCENRHLIGGLEFYEEPKVLRFFFGKLKPTSDWQERLVAKFKEDFGDSL